MFEKFEEEVKKRLQNAIGLDVDIPLSEPSEEFGDLSTTLCFELARRLRKNPKIIAEELAKKIKPENYIKEVKAVNGYINFYFSEKFAEDVIKTVKKLKGRYGSQEKKNIKVILEHTSANPDGPLHIGHGRNAIIGDSLARILKFSGYDVETQYYVNDMGRQLAVAVFGAKKFGINKDKKNDFAVAEAYVKANKFLEENPEYEKEIAKLMKEYEEGKKDVVKEFHTIADYCLKGIKETLKKINIFHDKFVFESEFVRNGLVYEVVERLKKTKYFEHNEVMQLNLKEFGIEKKLILTRSDGTFLYTTRDIAYHVWKSRNADVVIDIFGADHKLVAEQLKAALRILNEKVPDIIIYEFLTIEGMKMSTRKGRFISLDELIDESIKRAYEEVDKRRKDKDEKFKKSVAEKLGIGAIRFYIARVAPEKHMVFKFSEALDFEKHGLPFVQYAHARICRILEKIELSNDFSVESMDEYEKRLIKLVSKFPKIVNKAAEEKKPSLIANYLINLADAFHRFYMFDRVVGSEKEQFRANLLYSTKIVLANALNLLGIEPLEEM